MCGIIINICVCIHVYIYIYIYPCMVICMLETSAIVRVSSPAYRSPAQASLTHTLVQCRSSFQLLFRNLAATIGAKMVQMVLLVATD